MNNTHLTDDACDALSAQDVTDLRRAVRLLEENRFIARATAFLGRYVDAGTGMASDLVPDGVAATVQDLLAGALRTALDAALLDVASRMWMASHTPQGMKLVNRAT